MVEPWVFFFLFLNHVIPERQHPLQRGVMGIPSFGTGICKSGYFVRLMVHILTGKRNTISIIPQVSTQFFVFPCM